MKEKQRKKIVERSQLKREIKSNEKREFFHGEPLLNVIDKDTYQERVAKVFDMISKTLACSFGAYGSPTIISNYPFTHVTKDGYTIFKNLTCDSECGSLVDSMIFNMIGDVCGRLNYKVGDGTTTAIIATSEIYKAYYRNKKFFDENYILPRDIIKEFTKIKDEIVSKIREKSTMISDDKEKMLDAIRKIVSISSNGNEEVTNMIVKIYEKIGYPSISVELAKDNITRYTIIEGFKAGVLLTDKIYINTDDNFCETKNIDVLVFDHRVETDCYNYIIRPLHYLSKMMGRSLLIVAPSYSESAMSTTIKSDIMNEYKKTKNCSLILTTCRAQTANAKRTLSDLAMLLNTTIIDRDMDKAIVNDVCAHPEDDPFVILSYFDYHRGIDNVSFVGLDESNIVTVFTSEDDEKYKTAIEIKENAITVGFAGSSRLGVDYSVFSDFHYNEDLYEVYLDDAKKTMDDLVDKYAKLGTFNYEVTEAMKRYSALQLKTAVIEAGGDSELSKAMLKDTIDDAVRAADSAYNNGYILGCNVTTNAIIKSMLNELWENEPSGIHDIIKERLLIILANGFTSVYMTILNNAYPDLFYELTDETISDVLNNTESAVNMTDNINNYINQKLHIEKMFKLEDIIFIFKQLNIVEEGNQDENVQEKEPIKISLFNMIAMISIENEEVFDLVTSTFSKDIINSASTDTEVLTAIVDLMSILITGNQLVVTGKHNF